MDYGKINRFDSKKPQHTGKYLVRIGWIRGPWIAVDFDGKDYRMENGDVLPDSTIILWRVLYES